MFERRLKIFLGIICALSAVLLLRALIVQVFMSGYWHGEAEKSMARPQLLETQRGIIRDVRGREIAIDEPCIDAAVDYRAIVLDGEWIKEQAIARLLARPNREYRSAEKVRRVQMLEEEQAKVKADLGRMWQVLGEESGKTLEEIEQVKAGIRQRVEMRQRHLWYVKYQQALQEHEKREPQPWYKDWLLHGKNAPQIDSFVTTVGEQTEAHVIIRAISTETHNRLKKRLEEFPGLVLRPSKHRHYNFGESCCHVIGRLANVSKKDLEDMPANMDDLRQYLPNDLIGREGVEGLCEPLLRGARGRVVRLAGLDHVLESTPAVAGEDVRITLDMELTAQIRLAFERIEIREEGQLPEVKQNLHGAAVVMDVKTGEVRAMVSNPGFDPNEFDVKFAQWSRDDLNTPLLNRATQVAREPGSSIKTVVALGGITHNFIQPTDGIECTGYLIINGVKYMTQGRCWTARVHGGIYAFHHPVPIPHPTGFLTTADALERSCNVYFETLADRMGLKELHDWMYAFGLGRYTGIGIPEVRGRIPVPQLIPRNQLASATWFAGIGQTEAATPLQMANVAATIARNGVWVRPHLVGDEQWKSVRARAIARVSDTEDRRDLKLSPQALVAVREGMTRVVNSPAGTGRQARRSDMLVAGKTGSAQASVLRLPVRDENGALVLANGRVVLGDPIKVNTYDWYQGVGDQNESLAHAWYIGFAPADNPQIAFAVMVEFGGRGGAVAGSIARELLDACVKHGYLAK